MNIGIIGAGTMGRGIAQVAATAGCCVILYDTDKDALNQAESNLETILARLIAKNKLNPKEKLRIQNNISYVDKLKALANADLVIEAIVENLEIKKGVLSQLEDFVSKRCIVASNTSSLSIASIASAFQVSERVLGIHFFNPAPLMSLVEIIPAIQTSKKVLDSAVKIISNWGKVVAVVKDTPGFIVNRVARPFYGEALRIYEEGIADFATIDWSLKTMGGFRMGPFELMDFIGNDVNHAVTETVFKAFYFDSRYKPSLTQKRLIEAGYLGRKTGKGYYNYSEGMENIAPLEDFTLGQSIFERVLAMLINEAADALFLGVASAKDIDSAMTKGVNYPKGLLAWANEKGVEWCVDKLDLLYDEYREERYRCSPLLRKMNREHKVFSCEQ